MATIHEYHLKFEPTCIVCGKGFCKMASKTQVSMAREEEGWENKLLVYTIKSFVSQPTHIHGILILHISFTMGLVQVI